jgi:hypothetical protein
MKTHPLGAKLFHVDRQMDEQMDRQTDRHTADSHFLQFCKSTYKQIQLDHHDILKSE